MLKDEGAFSGRPGPRPRYTREEVVRAALKLIDQDGADSFSMRQLAETLGVGVMTLYGYVRSKEELFAAVCEMAFGDLHAPPVMEGPWDAQIRATVSELYEICRQHPNLVTLALSDRTLKPAQYVRRGRIIDALEHAGFGTADADNALAVLLNTTIGASISGGTALRDPSRRGAVTTTKSKRKARVTAHDDDTVVFLYGIDLLIEGLRVDLANKGISDS